MEFPARRAIRARRANLVLEVMSGLLVPME
jgi:hypothetical protein